MRKNRENENKTCVGVSIILKNITPKKVLLFHCNYAFLSIKIFVICYI